ncbi:hypothetical protein [Salinibacillus xinjiangensis]|uniref:Uncharacterized protein n=1 Tax=Salinibacillus xinjiangensis TaxID=1229268 RepID=A0A6G1X5G1_9BACI|nr:hypothetical protein [Salinibacillus xinjiangensis]MRG86204.1 hypothetical protein [Salinibacillus xinjiangensis]
MMTKKRKLTLGIVLIVIILAAIYWMYFSKPSPLPTKNQLVTEINEVFTRANAEKIQNTIQLDDKHVFVPFISKNNEYGLSYWVWDMYKWKVKKIDTTGEPMIWKVDKKDPSTFHIIWNMHPNDRLRYMKFYLIRKRGYQITAGNHHYTPRIQLEKKVSLEEKSYGVLKFPQKWAAIKEANAKVMQARQPDKLFSSWMPDHSIYIGWIPYDESNQETFPEQSVNGNTFSDGDVETDFVHILNESELEVAAE